MIGARDRSHERERAAQQERKTAISHDTSIGLKQTAGVISRLRAHCVQPRGPALQRSLNPNIGRNLTPIQLPGSAAAIHNQPCRLPEATPDTKAPMLHP